MRRQSAEAARKVMVDNDDEHSASSKAKNVNPLISVDVFQNLLNSELAKSGHMYNGKKVGAQKSFDVPETERGEIGRFAASPCTNSANLEHAGEDLSNRSPDRMDFSSETEPVPESNQGMHKLSDNANNGIYSGSSVLGPDKP